MISTMKQYYYSIGVQEMKSMYLCIEIKTNKVYFDRSIPYARCSTYIE